MRMWMRTGSVALLCAAFLLVAASITAAQGSPSGTVKFEVTFPATAHAGAITGRVFVVVSKEEKPEPRLQVGNWGDAAPMFADDINALPPGHAAVLDAGTLGYPLRSLREIPAGDYY